MNDYIKTMRKMIGNETLLTVGCGAIIIDKFERILLQRRTDHDIWGIPGGVAAAVLYLLFSNIQGVSENT
jgi:hypothetical protein